MLLHCNSCWTNAPRCYVIRALLVLLVSENRNCCKHLSLRFLSGHSFRVIVDKEWHALPVIVPCNLNLDSPRVNINAFAGSIIKVYLYFIVRTLAYVWLPLGKYSLGGSRRRG